MDAEVIPEANDRSQSRGRFLRRYHRYKVLLQSKWWILVLGLLLGVGGGTAVSWFRAQSFISEGRMIVSFKLTLPEGSVYAEEMTSFLGTQAALMQSSMVANRAWAKLARQGENIPLRPPVLKVTVLPKTSIFVLQATGENPGLTQAFLQACMDEYVQVKKEMRTQTSDTTLAGLTEEVLRLQKDLRKSDEELTAFQSTNSVEVVQEQGNGLAKYVAALNQRLGSLRSDYNLLQTLSLEQNLARREHNILASMPSSTELPEPSAVAESDYLKAKQQLLALKADAEGLSQFLRPKHPKMVALQEEIARRERQLVIFQRQSSEQMESRKSSLALQIATLEKEAKDWETKAVEVSRKNAEYQRLKTNSQRLQALYDRLLVTMQTLDLNKQINPESVTIMEPATPAFAERTQLSRQLLIGAVLGLALSAALLMFLDRLDDRINTLAELQELFSEEVVGRIPMEKSHGPGHSAALIEPEPEPRAFVEAYRGLRSSLLYLSESGQIPKTLLITSSVPNEGKSVVAANLAIILATAGAKVLLVDADLRKGGLHSLFGHEYGPGLSEVLMKGLVLEEAVQRTRYASLSLLQRGAGCQASGELFISKTMKGLLQKASAIYDYVILDTAPVLATDEATSLAPHVDGVLFLIRAQATSAQVARAALDLLYQRNAKVLGLVFNAVRSNKGGPVYYQYEGYHQTCAAGR
jgi:capsular exopolysaccharide synthesis family protein